jgi:hypothetical protein
MKGLRDSLTASPRPNSALVLLTMSTLLTLNYMINDVESFEVHLHALESMLESSSSADDGDCDRNGDVHNFVRGRVLAFGVLASFLQARQPSYATRINEKGHRISTLTYPGHPFSPELCVVISKLPEGFAEVALTRTLAIELISFLVKLSELVAYQSVSDDDRLTMPKPDMTMQRAIYDLQCLSVLPLTVIESQMVRALLAFCLHLYNGLWFHIPLARPLRPLLESFNEHTELPRPRWLQRCLYWSAIVVSSSWDTQPDASPRRHIVLDRLVTRVSEARHWEDTADLMRKFLWHDRLLDEWEVCWQASSFRTRRGGIRRGASHGQVLGIQLLRLNSSTSGMDSGTNSGLGSESASSEDLV